MPFTLRHRNTDTETENPKFGPKHTHTPNYHFSDFHSCHVTATGPQQLLQITTIWPMQFMQCTLLTHNKVTKLKTQRNIPWYWEVWEERKSSGCLRVFSKYSARFWYIFVPSQYQFTSNLLHASEFWKIFASSGMTFKTTSKVLLET